MEFHLDHTNWSQKEKGHISLRRRDTSWLSRTLKMYKKLYLEFKKNIIFPIFRLLRFLKGRNGDNKQGDGHFLIPDYCKDKLDIFVIFNHLVCKHWSLKFEEPTHDKSAGGHVDQGLGGVHHVGILHIKPISVDEFLVSEDSTRIFRIKNASWTTPTPTWCTPPSPWTSCPPALSSWVGPSNFRDQCKHPFAPSPRSFKGIAHQLFKLTAESPEDRGEEGWVSCTALHCRRELLRYR